jgi:hypothetical protein
MKSSSISFYFVLYLVAVITVFVITGERDQLLRQRDEDIAHLIEIYIKPLRLTAYADTARFFLEENQASTSLPARIRVKADGPMDREDIRFTVVEVRDGAGSVLDPASFRTLNESGDGVVVCPALTPGTYRVSVAGYKRRLVTDGRTMKVSIRDTTYEIAYSPRLESVDRDTAILFARVEKSGIVPPQLTLSVPESHDAWVIGPPYVKKIFAGGVEDAGKVAFGVSGGGRIEPGPAGASFVSLTWDQPDLGRHTFVVNADARRGLGEKDKASISFSVEIFPASFAVSPPQRGFWGIPYIFNGQIAGLSTLDLAVECGHDGQILEKRPVIPPDTVIPQRGWNALMFRVLYRGNAIKEHRVALESPPPPQIRWVQQNLDRSRNVFVITAESGDPLGGSVSLSLQSEPSGIAALDRIRGTRFTITVDLKNRPAAIFLKLTATDRFGGQSVSAKQFNIPQ